MLLVFIARHDDRLSYLCRRYTKPKLRLREFSSKRNQPEAGWRLVVLEQLDHSPGRTSHGEAQDARWNPKAARLRA